MAKRLKVPALLLFMAFLAYGILAPKMGFYWDALPIGWIRYRLGSDALTQYFSTNRPFWGMIYQLTTSLLPYRPFPWQIFSIFWRWIDAVLFWLLARELWKDQPRFALTLAFLFLLYPGFNQQSIAFIYSHYFIVLSFFLASLLLMLWGARRESKWMTGMSLILSAMNLLSMEYFFLLDLIRPILLWGTLDSVSPRERVEKALRRFLPYFGVFLLVLAGKLLLFPNQTYGYSLLDALKESPFTALAALAGEILSSLWLTLAAAWGQAFLPPDFSLQGERTLAVYVGVIFLVGGAAFSFLWRASETESTRRAAAKQSLLLGISLAFLGGIVFWLTGLRVSLQVPASRFTLAFMAGSVFFLAGLLFLLPKRARFLLPVLLIAFSAGRQFLWTDEFRRDWNVQKNLFWQMSWRIPALEPNTLLFLNEGALKFYADNSLAAPLNWIYAPQDPTPNIPYMIFYPRTRLGGALSALEANTPATHDFLVGEFRGNTSQSVAVYFNPPSCFRVLDPEIDPYNYWVFDKNIRDAARFSDASRISLEGSAPLLPEIYAPEPSHRRWCYYFERADLARQRGEWEEVAALAKKAFASGDYPNDPTERFVFIEGYAHTGAWQRALDLSDEASAIAPAYMNPLLCRLWARIEKETPSSPEKTSVLEKAKEAYACPAAP